MNIFAPPHQKLSYQGKIYLCAVRSADELKRSLFISNDGKWRYKPIAELGKCDYSDTVEFA